MAADKDKVGRITEDDSKKAALANALKKAEATGTSKETILANAGKPSFMVVDMRKALGMMVQLITPRAKRLHDAILRAATDWDGETDLLRRLG